MGTGPFVALLLVIAVLLVQAVADNGELRTTRTQLDVQFEKQTPLIEDAQKIRTQLEGISGDTAALAEQGNANAIKLRDQLAQQGVNIKPPAPKSAAE